jgi:DNA-binding transcriptional MerR regulator
MPEDVQSAEPTKKLYYSISEVSDLLGVKPHVLRYWESQFGSLRPKKSRAGNRMYRDRDVEILRQIQELLHVKRYTIAGARRELPRLRQNANEAARSDPSGDWIDPDPGGAETAPPATRGAAGAARRAPVADPGVGAERATSEERAQRAAGLETGAPSTTQDRPDDPWRHQPGWPGAPGAEALGTARPLEAGAEDPGAVEAGLGGSAAARIASAARRRHPADPSQFAFEVAGRGLPAEALADLRREIVGLLDWLESRTR